VKLALLPLDSEPRGTIFLNLAWLRTAALALRRLISRGTLARVALTQRLGIPPSAATQRQHGIDCACYYTENLFVRSPVEGHFCFEGRTAFERRERPLLESLSLEARDELLSRLEAEAARRRGIVPAAASRKARVAAEYSPLHPELWTLCERWLHRDFVDLVEQARAGELRTPPQLAPGIYTLPVFSELFCRLLTEELAHFGASGLPVGQPNSMNRHGAAAAAETPAAKTTPPQPQRDHDCLCMIGALLDELGLSAGLLDPLLSEWLRPLCAALPPLAAAGGASIDHHKAFVVAYRLGEDESLSMHVDNAEASLHETLG